MSNINQKTNHFVTGRVRLSYVHLNQPRAPMNGVGEAKFSVTVLVPKTDVKTKAAIDSAIQAAIQNGISRSWNGVKPPNVPHPMYDGDGLRPNGEAFGPECKGHWVFTASAKADRRPRVVDLNIQDIIDPNEIYSGIYGRVGVDAYPYNASGKRGIAFGLTNVQKLSDGEPLGSVTTAEDDFGDSLPVGGNYAQPYQAPQTGYPPQAAATQVHPITGLPM